MSFKLGDFGPRIDKTLLEKPLRRDGRAADQLRRLALTSGVSKHAEGSALIELGDTRVLCTASVEERVPPFLKGKGEGWVTAEYGMLPASTSQRRQRDVTRGRLDGRASEIQRLIGRSLRAVVDMRALGERTVWLDCDVLTADAGTRCASICGAYVALQLAVRGLIERGAVERNPVLRPVAAVSVAIVDGVPMLDPSYPEDVAADVDVNVVMTGDGELIELQATAERVAFGRPMLDRVLDLAQIGCGELLAAQAEALAA